MLATVYIQECSHVGRKAEPTSDKAECAKQRSTYICQVGNGQLLKVCEQGTEAVALSVLCLGKAHLAVHSELPEPLGRLLRAHSSSCSKNLLSSYHVPGAVLGAGDVVMKNAVIQYSCCTPSVYQAPFESRVSVILEPSTELHIR